MRFRLAFIAVMLLAIGCQDSSKQRTPTDKEAGQKHWNEARATILYGLAQDQYKAHDFDKCRDTIAQALRMTPEAPGLHTLLAKIDIEQAQLERAEQELETARRFGPREPEPFYLSGVIYQRWQKPQAALDFYRQASERAPAELAYLLAQGEMLVALNRVPDALQMLQSKVAYFENSGTIRDAVGQLLVQSGRYAEAADMLRQASILSEDNDGIRERLAMAYFYNKQYREAAGVLSQLVAKDAFAKRADLFETLGQCQMSYNDAHGARRSFETVTELNPASAGAWQSLGRAALQEGEMRRAELALRRAIGVDPSIAENHLLIGYVRLKEGKLKEALDSFRRASALDERDTVSLCMVGYTCEKLGRHDEAMQCYARAMKIKPGDDMASRLMAGIDK